VPDFLAQSYITDREQAIAAVGRASQIRSPLLLRAILVPGDETFLTLWRGPDADAVDTATRDVGHGAWAEVAGWALWWRARTEWKSSGTLSAPHKRAAVP
jgi:hypothetical protein